VTTNRIRRTVRLCVLSTLLALAAFSFLAFGSASAHAQTRTAQTASTTTTTFVRIIINKQGQLVFSPSAITVQSGAPVRITNRTTFTRFIVVEGQLHRLSPGTGLTINPIQSEQASICGSGATLTITVV
jgi:plastocyanin